jgi:NAD(P)-dependent dehydrogenase (short-subunit alcohol dehydrogenase family)
MGAERRPWPPGVEEVRVQLGGKVAVVTGAASGIGRATAAAFAAAGMRVVLADIEEGPLAEATAALAAEGAEVVAVPTDVSLAASVASLRDAALDAFGAVHVVHNNAGVGAGGPIWTLTEADWQWVLGVNLMGVVHGVSTFVPLLIEQGEGHVVNTASVAGLVSAPMLGPYNASKHAVVTLSETLHADLQLAGITGVGVSVVCPGFVRTRIAASARNRPAHLRPEGTAALDEAAAGVMDQLVAGGIDPAEVAAAIVEAVRENRFWVLTHPAMDPFIAARTERILAREAPAITPIL